MWHSSDFQEQWFTRLEGNDNNVKLTCKQTGVSETTGWRWIRIRRANDPQFEKRWQNRGNFLTGPVGPRILGPDEVDPSEAATRALEDFAYFRYRYLGRRSTPWQEEAAYKVLDWVQSPSTEMIVVNCPPGSGKSTLFVTDIPLWMICRDRTIRILIGSSTGRLAAQYTARIRRMLERTHPLPAAHDREQAEGCLTVDYGRFKPDIGADIWRREEFTCVSPEGESAVEDKEPTCSSYGMDSEFLGARANLVIWDDLVTGKILRSADAIENQRRWWSEEGETRVEPGGALILQGQRMGAEDLYRYALDQTLGVDEGVEEQSRYRHIIYPAHFEDRCTGDHETPTAYPQGCLLDPHRLPWYGANGLLTHQRNRADKYRVQYQQEDVDPANILVPNIWINGGRGTDGIDYPGCWDHHRKLAELPHGLSQPWYSIASADPSPTQYWAVQWWIYHPDSEQRFLLDQHRAKMDAPDFLDWNENYKTFHGLMHDWQVRSKAVGAPITHWIVEQNAAQRFILQYDHVKRWQRLHAVNIIPHNTVAANKLDPEYGIQMLANRYRYGNIRLPGNTDGGYASARQTVLPLVMEATRYPESRTDDCLMANWFAEYWYPRIVRPIRTNSPRLPRPTWMRRAS